MNAELTVERDNNKTDDPLLETRKPVNRLTNPAKQLDCISNMVNSVSPEHKDKQTVGTVNMADNQIDNQTKSVTPDQLCRENEDLISAKLISRIDHTPPTKQEKH